MSTTAASRPSVSRQSSKSEIKSPSPANSNSATGKPADYVYFDRTTAGFSDDAVPRAKAAQLKLEHFYKVAVDAAIERNTRYAAPYLYTALKCAHLAAPCRRVELERKLQADALMTDDRKQRQLNQHGKQESTFLRLRRTKLGLDNFRTVKVIGKGAFGEVCTPVHQPHMGIIFAMKGSARTKDRHRQDLRHEDTQKRGDVKERPGLLPPVGLRVSNAHRNIQLAHVRAERDVLAESNSPWVVQLFYSFQDPTYLYLIMEFLPGGDLMTMLIKYDTFSEDVTRFYMAECVLAIEAVHNLGFIHRCVPQTSWPQCARLSRPRAQ
jgi:protein-serine/threonine kinase